MCHLIYKISCTKLTCTKLGSSTGALFHLITIVDIIGFWDVAPITTCVGSQTITYIPTVFRALLNTL